VNIDDVSLENFDIIQLTDRVIDSTDHDLPFKKQLKKTIRMLHDSATKMNSENYKE